MKTINKSYCINIIRAFCIVVSMLFSLNASSSTVYTCKGNTLVYHLRGGDLYLKLLSDNAVRVRYMYKESQSLPDWVYTTESSNIPKYQIEESNNSLIVNLKDLSLKVQKGTGKISFFDKNGHNLLAESDRTLTPSACYGFNNYVAKGSFVSSPDEFIYGLGQFQDGYLNVKGLTRRLTQVNTQISLPLIISNKGYGILWNNYGLTDFNPADSCVTLQKTAVSGDSQAVNITTAEGNGREIRQSNEFDAVLDIKQSGKYALMLDVGQKMARKHSLVIDGKKVIDFQNFWLPPTASVIVSLNAGKHKLHAILSNNDEPKVYYRIVDNTTTFRSPVAQSVDYTVFVGKPDDVISTYRKQTGESPMMPLWSLGYIHCRERFHSQDEILQTANRFQKEKFPIDVIVQDWQYWGKYGWNAMKFDEEFYPNPKVMVDSLHRMDIKFMLSVWSKVDPSTVVGTEMQKKGYFIPNTTWVDFFNPDAASFYWTNFSNKLLKPYGIDAWWQDATEPENDDLAGRKVMNGKYPGEYFRNVYPLLVNKTVYEGCRKDEPDKRTMILTRCAFPGIQRYGVATWSGDIGNDFETLRRQITAGLGQMSAGLPWWTYDAGGFFRPSNQYTDTLYQERFMRWMQTSVFLPLMRVHGYMTNTEFWNYSKQVVDDAHMCLDMRYRLLPYIYSNAAAVSMQGSTLMRPLVMDFYYDKLALSQKYEYMFGKSLLIAPILEQGVKEWSVYLPSKEKWYDFWTNEPYIGGKTYLVKTDTKKIPVYAKAGSIIPLCLAEKDSKSSLHSSWEIRIFVGADGIFKVYEDDGTTYNYEKGAYSTYDISWNDKQHTLIIGPRKGYFKGMCQNRKVKLVCINGKDSNLQNTKTVMYEGKKITVRF